MLGDLDALLKLFTPRGVFVGPDGAPAYGAADIARSARVLLGAEWAYVAEPSLVLQAGRTALVIAPGAVSVVRRGRDGLWRYEICRASPGRHDAPTRGPGPGRTSRLGL